MNLYQMTVVILVDADSENNANAEINELLEDHNFEITDSMVLI